VAVDTQALRTTIKLCRDLMRKDAGTNTDVDRIPQLSWMLFLKCFEDLEENQSALDPNYKKAIPKGYRWQDWALNIKFTGPDLIDFVNGKLFPTLAALQGRAGYEQRDFIADIFRELENRIRDGYILRQIIDHISKISFVNTDNINTMALLYEDMLAELRDAAGSNGEFYTPRPVIRFIVEQIRPDLLKSETVLDPACGTGGFLIGSLEYMSKFVKTKAHQKRLLDHTLVGTDKKPMPYQLCVMNMLLHKIYSPNITRTNPLLMRSFADITVAEQHDVIMTNPPFGGEEESSIADNLPPGMQTTDTALAFLVYIMKSLKSRGRCAIILPDGALFSANVGAKIRGELLKNFNLHTIVRLPKSVFEPYVGIATNILFFDKTEPTKHIWYYQMDVAERVRGKAKNPKYTKTKPIIYEDFQGVAAWFKRKKPTENSWLVDVNTLENFNLDLKNPKAMKEKSILSPHDLVANAIKGRKEALDILERVKKIIDKEVPKS